MEKEWSTLKKLIWLHMILGGGAANWTTVTGTSPLSLVNALAKPIRSLVQHGKCVQDGTPTPSVPVDIVCNNGTLCMIDNELPISYKRITGIKFDGDFWYDTGEVLTGDDDVTMTLANTVTTGQNVFGSYNGTSSGTKNFSLFIYGGGSSSNSYFRYGEQLLRPRFGSNEHTITLGGGGTTGFTTDVTATPETFTTVATAYIGMLPNSSSPAYTGSIIGNILVGTRLKWIPCERESDGVVGYYEAVNGNFIAPTGTGTPTKGAYDYTHAHLAVVGTPEVLTVSATGAATQTASAADLFAVNDYKDTQEIIGGTVKRNVGIKVLDGTESGWALSDSGTTHRFRGVKPTDCHTPASRAPSVCTHFKYVSTGSAVGGMFIGASQYWYFIHTDQTIDTVEEWTAWLASQYAQGTPVIVFYPLAEETTEQVSGQPLRTSEGTTIIDVTAEFDDIELVCEYKGTA